jgi:hypothetical protein
MPLPTSSLTDSRSLSNFMFESDLLTNLGRDFRAVRPLVAWRRRIEALEPSFDRELPFAFDIEYWLRLMSAGGNFAVINDSLATICLTDDSVIARFWYQVMRDCERIAGRRQTGSKFDKRFFRLRSHRRQGLEPTVTRAWRMLPKALGWCHYRIYRASQKWAELVRRVQRSCKGEGGKA